MTWTNSTISPGTWLLGAQFILSCEQCGHFFVKIRQAAILQNRLKFPFMDFSKTDIHKLNVDHSVFLRCLGDVKKQLTP